MHSQKTAQWQQTLESAQKTALLQDGRRKVHYTFSDGSEMSEEYDAKSCELLSRRLRKKGTLGDAKAWIVEVGESNVPLLAQKEIGLMESSSNPVVSRIDKSDYFSWRIRNLPYPIDTYALSAEDRHIVIRTTNKKYFKKLEVTDLDRLELELDPAELTYAHANNTLIVSYRKPQAVIEFERKLMTKLKKLKSDGDVDQCKQQ